MACSTPRTAVIFTHVPFLGPNPDRATLARYQEMLARFIACNAQRRCIGIVYVYVDWGIREWMAHGRPGESKPFEVDASLLMTERGLRGILQARAETARRRSRLPKKRLPEFVFVGLDELIGVLNNLIDAAPRAVDFLCGDNGRFTYDAPKFVEAVIRLSRGDVPHLAGHPIVRVDADAMPTAAAIRKLLARFVVVSAESPFFFFSGQYGRADKAYDPINDYAVRTHWFFPAGTRAGDPRFKSPAYAPYVNAAQTFLADLAYLGAAQPVDHEISTALRELVKDNQLPPPPQRPSPQVISGAGLIMSRRNINILPPFMNFKEMTSWVDDHIKRLLHEMLGDMSADDLETEPACFQQERAPDPLEQETIDKTGEYLERLLRGCLLHAIICDESGRPTEYSKLLTDIAWYRQGGAARRSSRLGNAARRRLRQAILPRAIRRYDAAIKCWSSNEFSGYTSHRWATQALADASHRARVCESVVGDALAYVDLLLSWHVFTRAVERLSFAANDWLFRSPE